MQKKRRDQIGDKAGKYSAGEISAGETIYLTVADKNGTIITIGKINDKIKTSNKSIRKEHKNMPLTIKIPDTDSYDWGDLGPPPEPPKLVRQNATHPDIEPTNWSSSEDSDHELDIPLPIHTPNQDDDVPDSWEDL